MLLRKVGIDNHVCHLDKALLLKLLLVLQNWPGTPLVESCLFCT